MTAERPEVTCILGTARHDGQQELERLRLLFLARVHAHHLPPPGRHNGDNDEIGDNVFYTNNLSEKKSQLQPVAYEHVYIHLNLIKNS